MARTRESLCRASGSCGHLLAARARLFGPGPFAIRFGVLLWWAAASLPGRASANELDEFQSARNAYEVASYELSASLFEALVGGDVPRLQNRALVLESLKYLGASQLFLGQTAQAEGTLERLLRMEADYVLDPLGFPQEVQTLFARLKRRLRTELERSRAEAESAARARADEAERLRERQLWRQARLLELAKTERVEVHRSRLVAMLPFGVGQFHNGNNGLGLLLAVSEATLLGLNVGSYLENQRLRAENPSPELRADAQFAEQAWRYTTQVSAALLAVVMVAGVIDAQVRFQPVQVVERQRQLEPELDKPLDVRLGLNGLRVQF